MQTLASLASQNSAVLNEFTQVAFLLRFQKQSAGMGTAATAAHESPLTKSYRAGSLEKTLPPN